MLFVVKAELGFDVAAWRALPWWQQRMYLSGLQRHGKYTVETEGDNDGEPSLHDLAAGGASVEYDD